MPNELPVPDDLLSLIEKREKDDRRQSERRRPAPDEEYTEIERRTGNDRRQSQRRRDQ